MFWRKLWHIYTFISCKYQNYTFAQKNTKNERSHQNYTLLQKKNQNWTFEVFTPKLDDIFENIPKLNVRTKTERSHQKWTFAPKLDVFFTNVLKLDAFTKIIPKLDFYTKTRHSKIIIPKTRRSTKINPKTTHSPQKWYFLVGFRCEYPNCKVWMFSTLIHTSNLCLYYAKDHFKEPSPSVHHLRRWLAWAASWLVECSTWNARAAVTLDEAGALSIDVSLMKTAWHLHRFGRCLPLDMTLSISRMCLDGVLA